jgi:hypothetical protein
LSINRAPGFSGPSPITDEQIMAWSQNTGTIIWPEEVDCIVHMDRAWRRATDKMQRRNNDYSKARETARNRIKGRR